MLGAVRCGASGGAGARHAARLQAEPEEQRPGPVVVPLVLPRQVSSSSEVSAQSDDGSPLPAPEDGAPLALADRGAL